MGLKISKNLSDAMERNHNSENASYEHNGQNVTVSKLRISPNLKAVLERSNSDKIIDEVVSGDIQKIDILGIKNSYELIEKLYQRNTLKNNEERDKRIIERWIEKRNLGNASLYETTNSVKYSSELIDEAGLLFEGGMQISGTPKKFDGDELRTRGKYDYRITLTNSSEITTEELIAFLKTFIIEANQRKINLRAKSLVGKDLFILYCHEEDLYNTVRLLEELRNDSKYGELVNKATRNFGETKEFSATLSDDAYYGISMATSETGMDRYLEIMNSNVRVFKGSYGGTPGTTFGRYMDNLLEEAYQKLLMKYNSNIDMITVDRMYDEMKQIHKRFMLGDSNSLLDIPFWMNLRNYDRLLKLENLNKNNSDREVDYGKELHSENGRGR